jgi:hypothetical protein
MKFSLNFPMKRLAVKAFRWRKPEFFNGLTYQSVEKASVVISRRIFWHVPDFNGA